MARRFGRNQKRALREAAAKAEARAEDAERRARKDQDEAAKCVGALNEIRRDVERLLGRHSAVLPPTRSGIDARDFPGPLGELRDPIEVESFARYAMPGERFALASQEVRSIKTALHRLKVEGKVEAARGAMHLYVKWNGRYARASHHVSPYYLSEAAIDLPSMARRFSEQVGEEAYRVLVTEWKAQTAQASERGK